MMSLLIVCLVVSLQANPVFFPEENLGHFDLPARVQQAQLPAANADLNIYALPVGQGDCTVIQCPAGTGGQITIVDIGSSKSTGFDQTKVIQYLSGQRIEKLFLTHSHSDHKNYMESLFVDLLANGLPYPPVYHSCPWSRYNINIPNLIQHEIESCCPCNTYKICQNMTDLKVLASGLNNCPTTESPNYDSIIIQVAYKGTQVFLPGDFEGGEDLINKFLANAGNIKSKVMRLSHHGSDSGKANTEPFLMAVNPVHVFSSSGLTTNYGHPRCSLYNILTSEPFSLQIVASHDYTCYCNSNKAFTTFSTPESIFTTTVGDPKAIPPQYTNYVIHYGIDSVIGDVSVDTTQV